MRPSNWIKRYIAALKDGDVFTTRCFMGFGSRAAIDQCLYRMVKEGRIVRLARGVFAKKEIPHGITLHDLAQVKARAFGKSIYEHGVTTASDLGLLEKPSECLFATDGCTSSFATFKGRIHIKSVSAKKRKFGATATDPLRRMLKGLWYLGKRLCTKAIVQEFRKMFNNRKGDEVLAEEAANLPHWLIEKFPFRPHLAIAAAQKRNAVSPDNVFAPRDGAPVPRTKNAASGAPQLLPVVGGGAMQAEINAPSHRSTALQEAAITPLNVASKEEVSEFIEQSVGDQNGVVTSGAAAVEPGVNHRKSKPMQLSARHLEKIKWFEPVVSSLVLPAKVPCEGLANEGLANEGLANEGLANEGLANEGLANEGLANEGLANEELANEGLEPNAATEPTTLAGMVKPRDPSKDTAVSAKPPAAAESTSIIRADGGSSVREARGGALSFRTAETEKWCHRSPVLLYEASKRAA